MKPAIFFGLLLFGLLGSVQDTRADSFLFSNGVFTTINVPNAKPDSTQANAINNAGQIAGSYVDSSGTSHGFLDTNGSFITIDPPGARSFLSANGINNAGQIVGSFSDSTGVSHGYLYNNGVFTLIDFPGAITNPDYPFPGTYAYGINDKGQIVGATNLGNLIQTAYLDNAGSFVAINVPGATAASQASAINNAGQIVGEYAGGFSPAAFTRGFLDDNSVFMPIEVPGSVPNTTHVQGINNAGQIVGSFVLGNVGHGFLDTNGSFIMINPPGGQNTSVNGINNKGEIVGTFMPIPEPNSLCLLISGVFGVSLVLFQRRSAVRICPH